MKKIISLAILPVIALASCSKNEEENKKIDTPSKNETSIDNSTGSSMNSTGTMDMNSTGSSMNSTGVTNSGTDSTGELNEMIIDENINSDIGDNFGDKTSTGNMSNSGTSLNNNISTGVTTKEQNGLITKEIDLKYDLPGGEVGSFKGSMVIESGKIKSFTFPKYEKGSYEDEFAKEITTKLVGKEVKGLKHDGKSGATLTTKAFNDFLSSL